MRRFMAPFGVAAVMGALLAFGAVSCGGDDEDDGDGNGGGGNVTVVTVTLREFEIVPDKDAVPAGKVTFRATNAGPADPHELVVVRTELKPGALPVDDAGKVDEEQVDALGEIEEFEVGGTGEITLDLTAGSYVLICNIVEEEDSGETQSHYLNGMRTAFTVE